MIAYCHRDTIVFVPRSESPRCPVCHRPDVRLFDLQEVAQILHAHVSQSSSPDPGTSPPSKRQNPSPEGGARPDGGDRRGEGDRQPQPPVQKGRPADTLNASLHKPGPVGATSGPDSFSGDLEAIDKAALIEIHRRFVQQRWFNRSTSEQMILLRDEFRARGVDVREEEQFAKLDAMRESWIEELRT